jgi:hypothetical protein
MDDNNNGMNSMHDGNGKNKENGNKNDGNCITHIISSNTGK